MAKTQMEMLQACINSLDNKNEYEIVIFNPDIDIDVIALITTKKWDDGSPVTKYFHRDNQKVNYTFESDTETLIVFSGSDYQMFWYQGGIWYSAEMDTEYAEYIEAIEAI